MPRVIAIGLLAVVAIAPWLYGGVLAEHQVWLAMGLVALTSLHLVYSWTLPDTHTRMSPVTLLLIAGLAMHFLQLMPIPTAWQPWLAAQATQLRREYTSATASLPDEPARSDPPSDSAAAGTTVAPVPLPTRSLYPAGTRQNGALFTLAAIAFVLASATFRSRDTIPWLLGTLTILGASFSLLGIVQRMSWNGMIYWAVPLSQGGRPFGPMVNENNAGGLLNICLAAGIGWLLWWAMHDRDDQRWGTQRPRLDRPSRLPDRLSEEFALFFQNITADKLGTLLLTGCIAGGVLCTLSRGSVLAMLCMLTVVGAVLATRKGKRRATLTILGVVVGAIVLTNWVGQSSRVRAELNTLSEEPLMESGRAQHWPDALQTARQFLGFGTGMGTYRYAYALHDTMYLGDGNFYHAENQYLEALMEAGLPGLALLLAAIGVAVGSGLQLLRSGQRTDMALGSATLGALASQVVSGAFDFGLYIPSNFLALAVICGAACGRVARPWSDCRSRWLALPCSAVVESTLIATLLVVGVFATVELRVVAVGESAQRALRLELLRDVREASPVVAAIKRLDVATQARPDDADLQRYLAEALQQRYRVGLFEELTREEISRQTLQSQAAQTEVDQAGANRTDATQPPVLDAGTAERLWDRSGLWQLHRAVLDADREGDLIRAATLRSQDGVITLLRPAWRRFLAARAACPLVAHVHYALAELAPIVEPENVEPHLTRARSLAQSDATLWYWSGMLDWNARDFPSALTAWKRSLAITPLHRAEMFYAAAERFPLNDVARAFVPDNPIELLSFIDRHLTAPEWSAARETLYQRAHDHLIRESADSRATGEHFYLLGRCAEGLGDLPAALDHYQAAVEHSAHEHAWRFRYAQLALNQNDLNRAYEAARQLPNQPEYRRLLEAIQRKKLE